MNNKINVTDKYFDGLYRELNGHPFNVDEILDKSFYSKSQSIIILMFNGYLQENNYSITAEMFKKELENWLKLELLSSDEKTKKFLFDQLVYLSASFHNSEGTKQKQNLISTKHKFADDVKRLEKKAKNSPEFQMKPQTISELNQKKRFNLTISSKGKNLRFLLQERLTIFGIKESTKYTFEAICFIVTSTYQYFHLIPGNTAVNYAHSLKTNIYQFFSRKKEDIYKLFEMEKNIFGEEYYQNKEEIDSLIDWIQSITK